MIVLALMPDAFAGFGGIAQYNRDLLRALAGAGAVREIHCLPRNGGGDALAPAAVREHEPRRSPAAYALHAWRTMRRLRPDLVLCGHLHLLPLAAFLARGRAPLVLELYGIEAWSDARGVARHARAVTRAIAISRCTRERFLAWCPVHPSRVRVLPNAVHPAPPAGADAAAQLRRRFGLEGRRVLLTVSRLAASEAYKGHDRIIAQLPRLVERVPDLVYLVVGDGDDRRRLETLAACAGMRERVVFAGRVPDDELAACYDAADAFAMPSTGEGFGFVFLEAAMRGLPVLGGDRDGSWDALREGRLGIAVDPDDEDALLRGLLDLLGRPRARNAEADAFRYDRFAAQAAALVLDPP